MVFDVDQTCEENRAEMYEKNKGYFRTEVSYLATNHETKEKGNRF